MHKNCRWFTLFLVIAFGVVACTSKEEKHKKQAAAYRELAEAYFLERQYSRALQELLKAEKLRPEDALIQNGLGLVYMMKGKYDLSETHFKKAIKLQSDYAEAINNLATVLLRQEKWDEAIIYLADLSQNLVYTTPQYPLLNLGWAYFNKKEYAQAEKYYKLTLKHYDDGFPKDMTYIKALGGLGRTYTATGKFAEALGSFGKAIKWAPTVPDTYYYMGRTYQRCQDGLSQGY